VRIQSAPPNEKRFISTMIQHLDLCNQYVRAFGNGEFEPPDPYEEMVYIVGHHEPPVARFQRVPARLLRPTVQHAQLGLYNERYGLTQFQVLGGGRSVPPPPGEEETVKGLLDGEVTRQERLKAEFGANPETAG